MTDAELAAALRTAHDLEQRIKAYAQTLGPHDLPERDAAQIAARQATALRKPLETWIATRALRAAPTT